MTRTSTSNGTPWEQQVGYSRAVRVGNHVFVSGTTASQSDGRTVHPQDAYEQTRYILHRVAKALEEVGASLADVTRTRMFVTDINEWPDIGRAHGEFFGDILPAATMVQVAALINPDHRVEIEVDAVISS